MSLQQMLQEAQTLFTEQPTYTDGPATNRETHTQNTLTAASTIVDTHVKTVPTAAQILLELAQDTRIDWDVINDQLIGWDGVMESLRDIITTAIAFLLRLDPQIAAEELRRAEGEKAA